MEQWGQYSVESKRMRAIAELVVPYSNGTKYKFDALKAKMDGISRLLRSN